NTYKSEEIGKNYSVFGKYISPDEIMAIIMNIQAEDIINMANKIFSGTTTSAIIGPNNLQGF
ncbi:MAG: insulinase family protein, partial [Rickettsia sp.]